LPLWDGRDEPTVQPASHARNVHFAKDVPKEKERARIPRRQCNMCSHEFPLSKLVGPVCDHVFCRKCIYKHVVPTDFLRRSVKCPCCEQSLHPTLVRHIVGEDVYRERQAVMVSEDEEFARHINLEWQNAPVEGMNARREPEQASWMNAALLPAVGRMFGWDPENNPVPNHKLNQQEKCGLCHMMFCRAEMVGPGCAHIFCDPCYTEHILQSDFRTNIVLCPGLGCGTVIEREEIERMVQRMGR